MKYIGDLYKALFSLKSPQTELFFHIYIILLCTTLTAILWENSLTQIYIQSNVSFKQWYVTQGSKTSSYLAVHYYRSDRRCEIRKYKSSKYHYFTGRNSPGTFYLVGMTRNVLFSLRIFFLAVLSRFNWH